MNWIDRCLLCSTILTKLPAPLYDLKTTSIGGLVVDNYTDNKAISAQLSWRLAGWLGQSLAIFKIKGVPKKDTLPFDQFSR